ncbi:MAG: ADP-ribosylglycohydrolase family protein [Gammaproteobacteria bacterium]
MNVHRAPGNTCLGALAAGGPGTPADRINNSKGCGGVMRVAPIDLMRGWSSEQVFDVALRAAAVTHGHPSGFLSAGAMALMIQRVYRRPILTPSECRSTF